MKWRYEVPKVKGFPSLVAEKDWDKIPNDVLLNADMEDLIRDKGVYALEDGFYFDLTRDIFLIVKTRDCENEK